MPALMWFRSDLRISDNAALQHACRSADEGVIAVFALCSQQRSNHGWGPMKVDLVLRNLRALTGRAGARESGRRRGPCTSTVMIRVLLSPRRKEARSTRPDTGQMPVLRQ